MNNNVVEHAINTHRSANRNKPWMTARLISKKLESSISAEELETKLLEYCKVTDEEGNHQKIRYSGLPSLKTLEVLWGAVDVVGHRSLDNITQNSVADGSLDHYGDLTSADVFFSHSHKDSDGVFCVARYLLENGVVPWVAETQIDKDEHINHRIIEALDESQDFILYLSPNALRSRWTGKEYVVAKEKRKNI